MFSRVDGDKPNMGLTHYKGKEPTQKEAITAKNYLSEQELDILNRLVNSYLEFAELQARQGRLMKMEDWANKLDEFLKLSDFNTLTHSGKITAEEAKEKAKMEYDKFRRIIDTKATQVDRDLSDAIKKIGIKPN
ncbi:RhuM family protein [Thorsellia kenyensis]|uniref:RhuM family protein n=1 Tax=Thorsellia kenyensis TaxID=1549888 RepID=A0ABV6CDG1_9GAMM